MFLILFISISISIFDICNIVDIIAGVDAGSNEEKANKKKAKKQKKQKKQKKEKQKEKKLQQTQQESNNNTLETIKTTNEVGRPTKGADAGEKVKLRSGISRSSHTHILTCNRSKGVSRENGTEW